MAKGAATLESTFFNHPEDAGLKKTFCKLTFDDNYATGGYGCDLTTVCALGSVKLVALPPTVAGYVPEIDLTNDKMLFYQGNNDGLADGPLVEVADNDANLKTKSMQFCVFHVGV